MDAPVEISENHADPRVVALTEWLSENLTWSAFMCSPDEDVAHAIIDFLDAHVCTNAAGEVADASGA